MASAIDELITTVRTHYPDAQFEVMRGLDEPESIRLTTTVDIDTVDIDETEDIVDLVIDRLLELQIEERLPIHVIPLRPVERATASAQSAVAHLQSVQKNSK
jgi:hypothetical protein